MRNLSQKEQAVLECIRALCKKNGFSPSVRDLCSAMGYKSTSTVQMYLDRLAEYGYIRRADGKSRSILLCESAPSKTIKCLRRGILPLRDFKEDDIEGEFPFAYGGDLPDGVTLVAYFESGEWWIIALGKELSADKPKLYVQNGVLAVDEPSCKEEAVGVLLAKIRL